MKKKETTLLIIKKEDKILLARKKRGFGLGKWNGIGGKIENKETPSEAMIRETEEEIFTTPIEYKKIGIMHFIEYDKEEKIHVNMHLYIATKTKGLPKESEEIEKTYSYSISSEITDINIANMITKGTGDSNVAQWLVSHSEYGSTLAVFFGIQSVINDNVGYTNLGRSNDTTMSGGRAVRPIVTLQSNIQLEGNSENGWMIKY